MSNTETDSLGEYDDYIQEIARSSFGDMLHDTERNQKYYRAIKVAIDKIHSQNREANVLDIGTGTGLLSMMAVRCGADSVTACEQFKPIADCAKEIIKDNGFEGKIQVITKDCRKIEVGDGGDMKCRANILVTEVFDTELIGEGAISIFDYAHQQLLEKNCIVVPDSATIYAQVVDSPFILNFCKLHPDLGPLKLPDEIQTGFDSRDVYDIQMSQIPIDTFKTILPPTPVFSFDWSGKTKLEKSRQNIYIGKAEESGVAQIVFMWWDLNMDVMGDIVLSCAPYWTHPDIKHWTKDTVLHAKDAIPWRDHWIQAIYYTPEALMVNQGDTFRLISNHDEYSLWFDITFETNPTREELPSPGPFHSLCSRTRIGQLNDPERNRKFLSILKQMIRPDSVCLHLQNFSLFGLLAAKLGAQKVYIVYESELARIAYEKIIEFNQIEDQVTLIYWESYVDNEVSLTDVNFIFGEPYFSTSLLPWHNITGMIDIERCISVLDLPPTIDYFPKYASLHVMAVEFYHLHKIKTNINICEGFNIRHFDQLIELSSNSVDESIEPQPLWEYSGNALSLPQSVAEFKFGSFQSATVSERIEFKGPPATLNGIAFWIDWKLDDSNNYIISTGPVERPEINKEIKWDKYTRQGVYLFKNPVVINCNDILNYSFNITDTSRLEIECPILQLNENLIQ